jgi:hypothetical protein
MFYRLENQVLKYVYMHSEYNNYSVQSINPLINCISI